MMTYLWLNGGVMLAVAAAIYAAGCALRPRLIWGIMAAMVVLTAVFDSVIVGLGIVAYDPAKIIGLTLGAAPLEDFAYCLVAAVLVPFLWEKFK